MATDTVQELRQLLRKKFPQAHQARFQEEEPESLHFDFSDPTILPAGALSEIVPEGPEPILGLVLAQILSEPEIASPLPELVLVDGDAFDPNSFNDAACSRLLWIRCHTGVELLKAADLIIRDGNIPFVLLDACGFPARELKTLPDSAWWRLKQIAERTACRVVVMAPFPLVACASLRLSLSSGLSLKDFDLPRSELSHRLHVKPNRVRRVT